MRRIVTLLIVSTVLLAACGGGGGGNKTSKADQQQFTDLSNKAKTARFRVTYETHDDKGATEDAWTLSQESETKKAYITKDSKIVVDGDKAYNCNDLDTTPTCDEVPGGSEGAASMIAGFAGLYTQYATALTTDAAAAGFSDKSDDTIAGRDALCVKWTIGGAAGNGIAKGILNAAGVGKIGWESCVDKQTGVALRVKYTGPASSGQVEIVATAFGDPQDSDFDTPTTTTTSEASTDDASSDTTEPSSDSTTPDSSDTTTTVVGDGSTGTTCITLPSGVTLPGGVTLPCITAP
jgi:hypothetical protein